MGPGSGIAVLLDGDAGCGLVGVNDGYVDGNDIGVMCGCGVGVVG